MKKVSSFCGVLFLGALLGALLGGCRDASRLATQAVAGKDVADKMTQPESEKGANARAAQAEADRQNADARIALGQHINTTWMEFRSQPKPIRARQNAVWTLNIWRVGKIAKNGNWVEEFKYDRGKLMRLVVVSKDLNQFNLLFPDFRGDGLFITSQVLPHGGNWKIFADYTPMQGVQEVAQHDFRVEGAAPAPVALVPNKVGDGEIVKRVVAKAQGEIQGEPDALGGEIFSVSLRPQNLFVGADAILLFSVFDAQNRRVASLQSEDAPANIVILSGDSKIYLNVTSDSAREDDNATGENPQSDANSKASSTRLAPNQARFRTVFPAAGIYKIWAQFRLGNRVVTAPFVVDVAPKRSK